jgi:hypothetical protein
VALSKEASGGSKMQEMRGIWREKVVKKKAIFILVRLKGCGVIDDCEVSVGVGQGLVGEEALSNRKGVESIFLSLKIALHFSVT